MALQPKIAVKSAFSIFEADLDFGSKSFDPGSNPKIDKLGTIRRIYKSGTNYNFSLYLTTRATVP